MTEDANNLTNGYRSGEFVFRSAEGEHGIIAGRMIPYDTWARIDSIVEGKFYERFRPRSITKTLQEKAGSLRILFEHGFSPLLGKAPIAKFEGFREEADGVHYTASLLRGVPELIMDGLRANVYGASVFHKPVKADVNRRPGKSEHNPEGWTEVSVNESKLKEFSIVTFPAYAGSTAGMRSLTDEIVRDRMKEDAETLLQLFRGESEPEHSEPADPEPEPEQGEDDSEPDTGSRPTQPEDNKPAKPTRDWLAPTEENAKWGLIP